MSNREYTKEQIDTVLGAFTNQETGFGRPEQIAEQIDMSVSDVKNILEKYSEVYTRKGDLARKKDMTIVKWNAKEIGEVLHADIFFLKGTTNTSTHKRPVLICVDVFTRYTWLYKVSSKSAVLEPFKEIVAEIKRVNPSIETIKVVTDGGQEFNTLKRIPEIDWIISNSIHGAAIAEAGVARTRKLLAQISAIQYNWSAIAKNLNTINGPKMMDVTPYDMFWNGRIGNWNFHNQRKQRDDVKKFAINDTVRKIINDNLKSFEKYTDKLRYSKEIYTVKSIENYQGIVRYKISPVGKDNVLKRQFYPEELRKIDLSFLEKY